MLFNIDKCKVMHLGFNNFHATYSIDGLQLQTVSEEKDLGVIMSDNMKWEKQYHLQRSKPIEFLA